MFLQTFVKKLIVKNSQISLNISKTSFSKFPNFNIIIYKLDNSVKWAWFIIDLIISFSPRVFPSPVSSFPFADPPSLPFLKVNPMTFPLHWDHPLPIPNPQNYHFHLPHHSWTHCLLSHCPTNLLHLPKMHYYHLPIIIDLIHYQNPRLSKRLPKSRNH